MTHKIKFLCLLQNIVGITGIVLCSLTHAAVTKSSQSNLFNNAMTDGKFHLLLNYRFEHVDGPIKIKDTYASTLRSVIAHELCKRLKADPVTKEAKMIVKSGCDNEKHRDLF